MKAWKKEIVEKLVEEVEVNFNHYFFFRPFVNALGYNHIQKDDVVDIMNAFLKRCPNMKAYYDDSHKNSLFCGLWFAEKTMIFEEE